jgi:hypothetical protein
MRLRPRRRNLVVWSSSAAAADGRDARRPTRYRRIRRWSRIGGLLAVIGLVRLAAVQSRWRLLLAGVLLTVAGVIMRGGPGSVVLLPGLLFLLTAPLLPGDPEADGARRGELERELAAYSTPAQRYDLEATLDQYPDGVTHEIRDILARQAIVHGNRPPGAGPY